MKKFIINLLFPIRCLRCGKEGKFICAQCFGQIPPSKPIKLDKQNSLKKIIAATDYEHTFVKNIIHRYKYDFVRELSKPLGILMAKKLNKKNLNLETHNYILIPVPLHKKRLRWRGFNQSELLCLEISKQLNIPVVSNILIRTKNTPPQAKIENLSERKTNIQKAFSINHWEQSPISIQNKTIILVDDIATTGATLQQCANTIALLKPKFIHALVIAR